jgi:hypothetical protein
MRVVWTAIFLIAIVLSIPAWADENGRRPDISLDRYHAERGDEPAEPEAEAVAEAPAAMILGDSPWEEYYRSEVDLSEFFDRLYTVLTSEEHLGGIPEVAAIGEHLNTLGFFDFGKGIEEYVITGDYIRYYSQSHFPDMDPECYYGSLFSIPDRELHSAKYLSDGDYMLYLGITGLTDKLLTALEMPTMQITDGEVESTPLLEMLGQSGDEDMQMALGAIHAMKLDELVDSVLTGELALVLYRTPSIEQIFTGQIMPQDVGAALMLGLKDPDYVTEMIETYGAEIGLMGVEMPGDAWRYFRMEGEESVGMMYNDEMLIVSPDIESTVEIVGNASGLEFPECQMYLDLDVQALHEMVIQPLAEFGTTQLGEEIALPIDSMAYLVNLPDEQALGHITLESHFGENTASMELEMKKAVLQYVVYYVGVTLCGMAQAGAFN